MTELTGLPAEWFTGYHEIWFTLKLRNGIGEEILCCTEEEKCRIKANWFYTPIYYGMSPNVMFYNQKSTLLVDPREVPDLRLPGTFLHSVTPRIDDHELDTNPFTDEEVTEQENLAKNELNFVRGYVKTEAATSEARVTAWFHGSGYAYDVENASKTCLIDGTTCYDAKILPVIESIDKTTGLSTGGQEITMRGTSLNATTLADAVVEVDGAPCTVTESEYYQLKC